LSTSLESFTMIRWVLNSNEKSVHFAAVSTKYCPISWDAAAVEVVVAEAGGRFSDWHGRPRIDSGDGLATNGLVHAEVLASLRLP